MTTPARSAGASSSADDGGGFSDLPLGTGAGVSDSGPVEWSARLVEVRVETPTVRTFCFERPERGFSYRPGQYLTVRLPGVADSRGDSRTFTISSPPSSPDTVSITTRSGPSPFKQALFRAPTSTVFELWGPFGTFVRDPERPAVFMAGGIGVTPFRSMILEAASHRSRVPVALLYSNRTTEEIVFRSELEETASRWSSLHLTECVTRPESQLGGWTGVVGRIDATLVRAQTGTLDAPLYYVSGPPTMVQDLERILRQHLGVPSTEIRTELFHGY
ncbi:MAG TPA: FAD-dependent oxidoreductase [Thermoplasmata archaeon]|nr:FAD-dependent oxidoreductase [Thermoplasmata archaeon]